MAISLVKHCTELAIFYKMQHGLREKRSRETQLILSIDELAKTCRLANILTLFVWILEKLLIKLPMKNSF